MKGQESRKHYTFAETRVPLFASLPEAVAKTKTLSFLSKVLSPRRYLDIVVREDLTGGIDQRQGSSQSPQY